MKATFDLAIGNAVPVRAARADNPGRLGGSGIACCRGAIPGGFTCKETAGRVERDQTISSINGP
jgi:hypothetical protein